jgi:hypothetical protein
MDKKFLKLSLLALGVIFMPVAHAASVENDTGADGKYRGDVSGHTFLSIRPQFQSGMPEKESLWRRRATPGPCGLGRECGLGGAFQVVGFGGRSTRSARLGEFFMYGGSNQLFVSSNQAQFPQVNPIHFGLAPTPGSGVVFTSTIQFNPRQSVGGAGFEWRQYLSCISECTGNWWFDISFPVVQVSNRVTLTEISPTITGGALPAGSASSMTQAFQGTTSFNFLNPIGSHDVGTMMFGLIPSGTNHKGLRRTGVADVEIKIGYDALCTECCFINGYLGVLVPTGNRPKGRFIFEPIVGHNRHVGFLFGSEMFYDVWSGCDRNLTWETSFDSRYLFSGKETRSFDLRYRPWSRYLLVFANAADAAADIASPGINFFTQEMKVTPRFQTTMNTALCYSSMCGLQAELGYNFWARQAEKIRLKNPFPAGIAVVALDAANVREPDTTNILSNIGNNNSCGSCAVAPGCTSQLTLLPAGVNTIRQKDLDLASAANPATLSNIIYGTVGYDFDWCCLPMFVGVGGSYEFSSINTSINRWNVWGKFGISF